MRINVYDEEITNRIEVVEKSAEGRKFYGLRIYLKTHPDLVPPKHQDDDSSAVTFWFDTEWKMSAFAIGLYGVAVRKELQPT